VLCTELRLIKTAKPCDFIKLRLDGVANHRFHNFTAPIYTVQAYYTG